MGMKAPIRTMNGDRMVPKSLLVRTTLRMEAGLRILLQSNAPHQTTTHAPLLPMLFKRDRFMLRLCGTLPHAPSPLPIYCAMRPIAAGPSLSKRTCNVINESNMGLAGGTAYIRDAITSWLGKAHREGIILRGMYKNSILIIILMIIWNLDSRGIKYFESSQLLLSPVISARF
ncbi:unnamed protein product [Clonostachys rosea f. rosea IK726]|uniref:Uncharacterized protein n=3 Tax=Bionectria ochroleuca TaxID=29856 RepID=A0A0B7KQW7_BIOOC|nr:unnamed protein product [Clonostachys rosea f. rosea IK726]CAG9955681.1 unnamed protein product [Clonostachys rosea f. rosea IK726]